MKAHHKNPGMRACHMIALSVLAAVAVGGTATAASWEYNADTTHYYSLTGLLTWPDAESAAIAAGGHLATVADAQENDWILQTFGMVDEDLWIGLTDVDSPGTWVWTTSEPVGYTNWQAGQPTGGQEHFAHMYNLAVTHTAPGTWNDLGASSPALGVIEVENVPPDLVPEAPSMLLLVGGLVGVYGFLSKRQMALGCESVDGNRSGQPLPS